MSDEELDLAVIGAGSWGTAIARLLAGRGHRVTLWARDPHLAREIDQKGENRRYLPGVSLPRQRLSSTRSLHDLAGKGAYFLAVPSFAMRKVARDLRAALGDEVRGADWISLTKGLEYAPSNRVERAAADEEESSGSGRAPRTMSRVLSEELATRRVFALSGPSFAMEVVRGFPTSVVLAGTDVARADRLQRAVMTERFRVYVGEDLLGVELGGATKNVIALAAGISDGLGFGDNAKGALVSRGLVEMTRLGMALGARKETFFGLAGLGDLVITCMSRKSRNHKVGVRIGSGEALDQIVAEMEMVAEGIYTARALHRFAKDAGIDLPITRAVHEVLYQGSDPVAKLTELMTREPKREEI